jgi:hypothetical protein
MITFLPAAVENPEKEVAAEMPSGDEVLIATCACCSCSANKCPLSTCSSAATGPVQSA